MSQGFLKDVTGNYVASFMVSGGFLILATLTMATLPHFFSCRDPPPPQKRSLNDKDKGLHSELEQINSLPADTNHREELWFVRWPGLIICKTGEIKHSKSLLKDGASLKRPSGNRLLHTCLCCTSEIQTQSEEKEAYCENWQHKGSSESSLCYTLWPQASTVCLKGNTGHLNTSSSNA